MTIETPRRFDRDPKWAEGSTRSLRVLQKDRRPFTADEIEWARAGVGRGDELGNRLARAMIDDRAFTMRDVDAAIAAGETEIPALRGLLDAVGPAATPGWVDHAACERGAAVCRRAGSLGLDVLATASLMTGYTTSATTRQLVATGRLVDGVDRRIHETTQWWSEIIAPGGAMRPYRSGWRAAVKVRVVHGLANTTLERRADWDRAEWGEPINQSDQLGTLGLFSTTFLLGVRALGMPVTDAEGRDVMALWRYVGWLLGIDEAVLPATEGEGRRRMVQIGQYAPGPDADSAVLGRALYGNWGRHEYPVLGDLRRRFYQRYLGSLEGVFAGPSGLRSLGLPQELPWAVPVAWVNHAPFQLAARVSPRARRWATVRGERQIAGWLERNRPR
ncbi:oxygenase MpaB family protein [Tsukamurella sp. 1534]|uniref:oxygenase MpaB family protein n=1 Tax=Tsukamurella sp. 1534 TaxID=1151061 RepID=UPI00030580E5|nr:oxygenase MpaB family protein [Tsukamurella sp. 1534]